MRSLIGNAATDEHGISLAKKRWWPQAVDAGSHELHRRVKQALDPHDLLNPGKFLEVVPAVGAKISTDHD